LKRTVVQAISIVDGPPNPRLHRRWPGHFLMNVVAHISRLPRNPDIVNTRTKKYLDNVRLKYNNSMFITNSQRRAAPASASRALISDDAAENRHASL
jgi:hypothetical protein